MMEKALDGGPNGAFTKGILAAIAVGTGCPSSKCSPTPAVWAPSLRWDVEN
jgi:hypothetical protein